MNEMPDAETGHMAVVVNDDLTQLKTLGGILHKQGLQVREFTSAEAALVAMERDRAPDIIVTDLYMPEIDGWRFCRLLRSPEYVFLNQVPIVVVSATFSGDEAERIAADLGVDGFLPAPVDGRRLIPLVEAILRGERPRNAPRVLIVEDTEALATLFQRAFKAHGYQVDVAHSAKEARRRFEGFGYDVAVLDYHLPDDLGDNLIEEFRARRLDCVCIMMTADPNPQLALDWTMRGAAAYLRKPFEPNYLVELCGKARRERAFMHVEDLLEARTRELRDSEERLKLALRGGNLGIWDVEVPAGKLSSSERWAEMLGVDLGELPSNLEGWFNGVHPGDASGLRQRWNAHLEGATEEFYAEYRMGHKSGAWVWIFSSGRVIERNEFREPQRVCGTHLDITERKMGEEERERLQANLIQAQKMESIGRLAGGVAHDFNNMLSLILGHAQLGMHQVSKSDKIYSNLLEIQAAGERSAELTRQLLTFARKRLISPAVLDLNAEIEGRLKALRQLLGDEIDLVWLPGAQLWPVKLDASQLGPLLAILCDNARDAIDGPGKVTLETGNRTVNQSQGAGAGGLAPGDYVRLAVIDDGPGMDLETQSKLFEPFFTTKEQGKGTGLGLASAYGIVTQGSGAISAHSEPGRGATFEILLPRQVEVAAVPGRDKPPSSPQLGRETILLVEDEPALLAMTGAILRRLGYTVLAAPSPAEAMRLARENAEDVRLLLTDVIMPEMNGWVLSGHIQKICPQLKLLFMSGYTADILASQGVQDAELRLVLKPFSIVELAEKVREALDLDP